MPKTVMTNEEEYALPAGQPFQAELQSVTERTITYTRKKDGNGKKAGDQDSFTKWIWEFKITAGDFEGMTARGETEDRLTNREDNLVRQWSETLLGTTIEVGQGLDTDLLIGLSCVITVRHEEPRPKKDGNGNWYECPVDDVFPVTGGGDYPTW